MSMERKIGEEFEVKLRVKTFERTLPGCRECVFYELDTCAKDETGPCREEERSDGKKVGFYVVSSDEE